MYVGDFKAGSVVHHAFSFSNAAGAAIDPTTAGTISIYKNGSITQRTSSVGVTYTTNFDGITGLAHVSVDLSDNTDAGFYAAGNEYAVKLVGAVVDGTAVNVTLFTFSLENRNQEPYVGAFTVGTVNDGTATATAFITNLSEATNDHYKNAGIAFTNGILSGQWRQISAYNGTTKQITVSAAFTDIPGNGDAFVVGGRVLG